MEREELFQAFIAGFGQSGEGFNAEYPFGDKGKIPEKDEDLLRAFQEWLEQKYPSIHIA